MTIVMGEKVLKEVAGRVGDLGAKGIMFRTIYTHQET